MRWIIAFFLLLTSAFSESALAQSTPLLRTIATHQTAQLGGLVSYTLKCPAGYIPTNYSVIRQYQFDVYSELDRNLVDRNNTAINRSSLSNTIAIDGGGYSVTHQNTDHHKHEHEVMVTCLSLAATTDNSLVLAKTAATANARQLGTATAFCSSEFPVALGGFSNADGPSQLDIGAAPTWGTSSNPVLLADLADGQTGPPTGWQVKVFNSASSAIEIIAYAICGKAPSLQTFVYSARVPQGIFGTATPFSIFAPVPEGWAALGAAFDSSSYGLSSSIDAWLQDGTVVGALQWYPPMTDYDSGTAAVRAFIMGASGNAPAGAPVRAVAAVLAVPTAPESPPTSVNVVEFYHAGLDHYFITANGDEITKLDNGTFVGWARTGASFRAYAIGSSGRPGRRPVCREYGRPEEGLNSHFYSASPDECTASLQLGGYTVQMWGLEASEVFQMDLPDAVTGACPVGGIPVYRIWNQRVDSNHRYTTSIAIRDQMVGKGGIAEGYGPDAVALCALP